MFIVNVRKISKGTNSRIKLVLLYFVFAFLLTENTSLVEFNSSGDLLINKSFKIQEGKTLRFESPAGDIRVFTSDEQEVS